MPTARLEGGNWPHPSRLPLGDGWTGHCTAHGHEGATPSQETLEAFCNLGYARGCSWAPAKPTQADDAACDAVRFAVIFPQSSKTVKPDAGSIGRPALRLHYVCERDHRPVAHGELEFDLTRATWLRGHDDPRIQKMAECFLDAYLKKKS